ncbi:uncharacterized protein BO80DRAFT_417706 [Aspergillus ibericus CBS 121593]|uniref:Phosphoribosyltransferase domain-containing protein n=1 Tax=Aspergillus ibericus CBS 121593 TaxID=1448316 RepID=A0A395GMJ2_9EURO|nr:hypothetical protein BO80DRAFT_417706 [Aspergillus ibericus CBS 121593]RAK96047.1 hypothetical protein BO80DRAFT_417706 [Aspergillus ibericus CBS 121593]
MNQSKPTIIGIYGIPGSGKTTLLSQLKNQLNPESFSFYDGSSVLDSLVPGDLPAFQSLSFSEKTTWQEKAITSIKSECTASGQTGIVTGHYIFWDDIDQEKETVLTECVLSVYTHILYLNIRAEVVYSRRERDTERQRARISISELGRWMEEEMSELTGVCLSRGILFVRLMPLCLERIAALVEDFRRHDEVNNDGVVGRCIDGVVSPAGMGLEKVLVFDADRTLAAIDTGKRFWEHVPGAGWGMLQWVFGSQLGYSYAAFRQVVLLYEQDVEDEQYEEICGLVAAEVMLYPEVAGLLRRVLEHAHIGVVVVTCGLRRVWEKVLEREGLWDRAKVIGSGRISDGYVVTPRVKGALVERLKSRGLKVWAFGDSPVDMEMLRCADRAVVIVGDDGIRSSTMNTVLETEIDHGFQAVQVLLPESVSPRLDIAVLPVITLDDPNFLGPILASNFHLVHATHKGAAKLLQTPMRDAGIEGPALRKAHRRAGFYLAAEYLTDLVGLEACAIAHVQGNTTIGHQLADEASTVIIALMRGGKPMAFGVNDAFPKASFLHAAEVEDVKLHHVQGKANVMLVDSVVNNGTTVIEFVKHIRSLKKDIRIAVVAGVVQVKAVAKNGPLRALARNGGLTVVALRLSENKYTGTKGTDTGNRLFNTVDLA